MRRLLVLVFLAAVATRTMRAQAPKSPQPPGRLAELRARGAAELLVAGKSWDLLGQGYQLTADSTVDKDGNVYFTDSQKNRILKVDLDGKIHVWKQGTNGAHGVAWGPDGRLYAGQHDRKRIVAFSSAGAESVIAEETQTHHLIVTSRNEIYFTEPPAHKVWMLDSAGRKRALHEGIEWPRALSASADRSLLAVNDPPTNQVWTFQVQADGSLKGRRPFCRLETGDSSESDAGGMVFDSEGFLYVATKLGIQVCDRQGRVTAIIDTPGGDGASAVFFGGPSLQWLYVAEWDKIYRRTVQRRGASKARR